MRLREEQGVAILNILPCPKAIIFRLFSLLFWQLSGIVSVTTTESQSGAYYIIVVRCRLTLPTLSAKGKKYMEKQTQVRRSSGAKALAVDQRKIIALYRLLRLQLLAATIFAAALAMGLHILFGR